MLSYGGRSVACGGVLEKLDMLRHVFRVAAIAAVLVACLFLPFLPGDYDRLAGPLATMAMLFGYAGLLLVPVGACWLLYEIKKGASASYAASSSGLGYYFAIAALVASVPVAAMVALEALVTLGPSAGVICLVALATWYFGQLVPRAAQLKGAEITDFHGTPLYLVVLPLVVLAALYGFGDKAAEFSRNRAIDNAAPFIADIEAYRKEHGRYPTSLASEWEDYKPSIMGIERYRYEPSGDAYNVSFEQFSFAFGTREFIMYNRLDEQEMTSHDMDLLRIAPEEIRRGYHAVDDAGRPHWKRFFFD